MRRGPLLTGLLLAVTLHAFHAMAVVVIVPLVAADLDGRALYGAVFSAYLVASVVGLIVAGRAVDRRGPRAPFATGLAIFAAGLVGSASAPTMAVLVAARALEGIGGGAVTAVLTATVNRCYGEAERPRILAWMSAAWVVPGLLAPPLAGWIGETWGWRWVFLGVLPLVGAAAALALPAMASLGPVARPAARRPRTATALGLVVGRAPARARVALPAAVATRLLVTIVFFGIDAFLPLALTDVRGTTAALAGTVMTIGALTWVLGAFAHTRLVARIRPSTAVALGTGAIACGITGEIAALAPGAPLGLVYASWSLAGAGMGLAYNATGTTAMAATDGGHEGETSTALGVADALGFGLAAGAGGAMLAWGERAAWTTAAALGLTWAALLVLCVPAVAAARGMAARARRSGTGDDAVVVQARDLRVAHPE